MLNTIRRWVRSFSIWVLANIKPTPDEIDQAILGAFSDCGLPVDSYSLEFDLLHSGKLHEVIIHSSTRLGNPLVTVKDLKELLG